MRVKDGSPLNAVRAGFKSIDESKTLMEPGKINMGRMVHSVKPCHVPVRINKCFKCLRQDHSTSSSTRPRLWPRYVEVHSIEHGCPNQERCINCGDQSKRQRAELPVLAERQQHQYDFQERDYPTLDNDNRQAPSSQIPGQTTESSKQSYAQVTKQQQREQGPQQHIEYTLSSFLNKMERRLDQLSFSSVVATL